jgi:hypothetical protein
MARYLVQVPRDVLSEGRKIRRSMALKVSLFWQMPSLDVKLTTKDQDLSFQRGPRLEQ